MDTVPYSGPKTKIDRNTWDSLQEKCSDFETNINIPANLGSGSIKQIRLKSGLHVHIHDYMVFQPMIMQNDDISPTFGFRFCISDHTKLDLECLKESLMIRTGESGAFYFPNMKNCIENRPGIHIHKIFIRVEPSFFLSAMEEDMDTIPFDLKAMINADKDVYEPYHTTDLITPSMRIIVEQIFRCPYEGITRRIFIEGKAMELIACKLDQIKSAGQASRNNLSLCISDIERIHFAEELLTSNLSSPPNTIELSKAIGVSRTKLYRGFNQLYGVSPMEYLRLKRIEKAREMVKDKDLNMTQIAYVLGYSSSSHFAKTFRDFFGMSPSHYRQNGHA
ncbi:AraC family transcriptional regulator [Desulfosarcina ovata subsp. sediminis]|uniref:AraC family transcriptional regulator n=1 Tax=Desulfosarcina ovata subsp. sediminis TaxID=885957 RepID=A0A5K7ZMQ1_9BACT|nr:helix-turn-helix domain-containing protein [Desulfosarcina ovata]BBO82351.1 AraC family transcriptional regulator [Desulfosarcina ovata subsp. sediminis]